MHLDPPNALTVVQNYENHEGPQIIFCPRHRYSTYLGTSACLFVFSSILLEVQNYLFLIVFFISYFVIYVT